MYHNLQPRVTRTLLHAFLDPKKALTQHYGAIRGLAALGSRVVWILTSLACYLIRTTVANLSVTYLIYSPVMYGKCIW